MKLFKKFVSILTVLCLSFSLTIISYADENVLRFQNGYHCTGTVARTEQTSTGSTLYYCYTSYFENGAYNPRAGVHWCYVIGPNGFESRCPYTTEVR